MSEGRPAADPLPQARDAAAPPPDEPPPILGRWGALYALVVVELAAIILLCGWITAHRP